MLTGKITLWKNLIPVLDLIYLDDCHTNTHVFEELKAFYPKVKPGKILAGHDFMRFTSDEGEVFGVIEAVTFPPGDGDNTELFKNEAADLLFHYLILLQAKGFKLDDIADVLKERHVK